MDPCRLLWWLLPQWPSPTFCSHNSSGPLLVWWNLLMGCAQHVHSAQPLWFSSILPLSTVLSFMNTLQLASLVDGHSCPSDEPLLPLSVARGALGHPVRPSLLCLGVGAHAEVVSLPAALPPDSFSPAMAGLQSTAISCYLATIQQTTTSKWGIVKVSQSKQIVTQTQRARAPSSRPSRTWPLPSSLPLSARAPSPSPPPRPQGRLPVRLQRSPTGTLFKPPSYQCRAGGPLPALASSGHPRE